MPDTRYVTQAGADGAPLFKADALALGWTEYQFEYIYALSRLADATFRDAESRERALAPPAKPKKLPRA